MTEDQIRDFREVAIRTARASGRPGAAKIMERLLEEREKLLVALRKTSSACKEADWCQECGVGRSKEEHMVQATATLAFAEEAAP